jgi:hypothetical protein
MVLAAEQENSTVKMEGETAGTTDGKESGSV